MALPESQVPTVVALGAALSANKGAASMLHALVDQIDEVAPHVRVVSLSTFPTEDREVNTKERLEIGSLTPRQILFPVLPLALLVWLVRKLGGSGRWLAGLHPSTRAIKDATVVADLAGISFVDGRGFPTLAYNVLMTGIPLLLGTRVVKCSQALGPFQQPLNRMAARWVLPRLERVVARGSQTEEHLAMLGLENAEPGADYAFLMEMSEDRVRAAEDIVPHTDYVVVSPSSVVKALAAKAGLDYIEIMVDVVNGLVERTGQHVVILAHSARPGRPEGRLNDIPVCVEIHQRVADPQAVTLIAESLDPEVLRAIISRASCVVTSRFHAMISALATATPVLVVGWSHKYAEVMEEFGLARFVIDYAASGADGVISGAQDLIANRGSYVEQIEQALPSVRESARVSTMALRSAIHD